MDWGSVFGGSGSGSSSGSSDWVSTLFQVGGSLLGKQRAQKANNQAAQTAQQANESAAATIAGGNQAAQERLARLEEDGRPGVDYLRTVSTSDPNMLTPQQNMELDNARRVAGNQLATTGLRGSGRAVTASLRKVNEGGRNQMIEQNRQRQGNAATALSNLSTGATTQMSSIDRSGASDAAGLLRDTGSTNANSTLANGSVANNTLGAISGIFAADDRNRQLQDRYGKTYAS